MAYKSVPSPSCPHGHVASQVHARGTRPTNRGTTRKWRCRYVEGDELREHSFTTLDEAAESVRDLLDRVVAMPECPNGRHVKWTVQAHGTYETLAGRRQRYRCYNPKKPGTWHTFTPPLPRSAVDDDTCCEDCRVLTPRHAGTEASTRRLNYPASVVYTVLRELSEGRAYTHASMRALEAMGRDTGRSRRVRGVSADALNKAGLVSPDRELKAHWHIAADILERFAPIITEPVFEAIAAEQRQMRADKLPVVYVVDEVPVKRDYARSWSYNSSPVVWNALVVARLVWQHDSHGVLVSRSVKLLRVRALPTATKESWSLVLSELDAPDFLVADGAAAIESAAKTVWGRRTTFVPCVWHAAENIRKRLAPGRGKLPEKVRDHLYTLTREAMEAPGPAVVKLWFDDLELLAEAADLPREPVAALRTQYEPLLRRSAAVASKQKNPRVPISNAAVENQIQGWVDTFSRKRGAMFANLARTNLLGDLVVAGSNGALLRQHDVVQKLRTASRGNAGWAPPPRALVEPAGTYTLRDPGSVVELLREVGR